MSAVANVIPWLCQAVHADLSKRRLQSARLLSSRLSPIAELLAADHPAALKYALALLVLIRPDTRLPLVPLDDAAKRAKLGKPDAYRVRYFEQEATPFERFFASFVSTRAGAAWMRDSSFAQGIARSVLARGVPQVSSDLKFLDAALERRPGTPVKALAYCFCEL